MSSSATRCGKDGRSTAGAARTHEQETGPGSIDIGDVPHGNPARGIPDIDAYIRDWVLRR